MILEKKCPFKKNSPKHTVKYLPYYIIHEQLYIGTQVKVGEV